MLRSLAAIAGLLFAPLTASAQDRPDAAIDNDTKTEVIRTLGERLRSTYVFPEIADKIAEELAKRVDGGAYASHTTARAFAEAVRADLREVGNDRHFSVRFDPSFAEQEERVIQQPSDDEIAAMRAHVASEAYGVQRIARLPGNIGYIDVRFFGPTEFVAPAYESAMQLLAGSAAIIIDLRSNGGGDPESVAQLVSHFFAKGDERHINSIYNRVEDTTREFWLVRSTETRFNGPVFLLTSDYTFSGGEEFAYGLKAQDRATLIGETTGGGANPGGMVSLGHDFSAFIPSGRAINPITGTNWEHVGVEPDHAVSAEDALASGYRLALQAASDASSNPAAKARYSRILASDLTKTAELPGWNHPRE